MATKEKVAEYLKISKSKTSTIDKMFETFLEGAPKEIQEVLKESYYSAVKKADYEVSKIYEDLFTDEEIDMMIELQSSPIYERIAELRPEIQKRTAELTFSIMSGVIEKLDSLIGKIDVKAKAIIEEGANTDKTGRA